MPRSDRASVGVELRRPSGSVRGRPRTDPARCSTAPARDTGMRIPATRQSPADRWPSPRPIAAPSAADFRARQHVLSRAEPQHVDAAAQIGQRWILRERRFETRQRVARRDRARASPGRGQPAREHSRHRLQARDRTASAASVSLPRASASRPAPCPLDETTGCCLQRGRRTRARRCDNHRAADIASRDRCATALPRHGATGTDGKHEIRMLRRAGRLPAALSARSARQTRPETLTHSDDAVFRAQCTTCLPRRPPGCDCRRRQPDHRQQPAGTSASIVARSPIVAWLCTVACRYNQASRSGVHRIGQIELHGDALLIERELRRHAVEQLVAAFAGVRGNQQRRGSASWMRRRSSAEIAVDLVVDLDARHFDRADLLEHAGHGRDVPLAFRIRRRRSRAARDRRRRSPRGSRETPPPACAAADR